MGKNKEKDDSEEKKPIIIRNSTDLQRLKLEKLMKNPDKPVMIPEKPKERGSPNVPDFVRNVMGSSAGAGSGEFHVYRHLRRKEYARQKYMQAKGEREKLDDEYKNKLEENKKLAQEKTAKKRAKRQKKKQMLKKKGKMAKTDKKDSSESSSESSDGENSEKEEVSESKEEKDEKPLENIEKQPECEEKPTEEPLNTENSQNISTSEEKITN
ncbi:unnamed protein product [Brassicogethes aeneus]|uniref:PRKR-interacting protein 1 homolog n=1 Tax=Brassicogethes aeneus TaxID=1431903 RepID=A0A9P0BIP8_BRAAE|nr:unnamed protein product [Brassicogethes aeneus]